MNRALRRPQGKPAPPAPLARTFDVAARHHRAGQLAQAEKLYTRILSVDARHVDSLNMLGLIACQSGQHDLALRRVGTAVALSPGAPDCHAKRASILLMLGRFQEALASCDVALRLDPRAADVHVKRANALLGLGRAAEALDASEAALRLNPKAADAHANRSLALLHLGQADKALEATEAALRLNPKAADLHSNRSWALVKLGRMDDALAASEAALRLQPGHSKALCNRSHALRHLGRHEEALAVSEDALRFDPGLAQGHCARHHALQKLERFEDALAACDRALRIDPDDDTTQVHRCTVLKNLGRLDDVLLGYETALRINPDRPTAHSNFIVNLHYRETEAKGAILTAARRFGAMFDRPAVTTFANAPVPGRRLRVGYVSGDFFRHPVGYFLEAILTHHARAEVDVFCYSTRDRGDDLSAKLRSRADHWRRLVSLNDEMAATLIRADAIDILVDLSGHTAEHRLRMFARKPAPVQVSWLGYFGTTGLAAMDYVLADRYVVPQGDDDAFTERVWRLPGSYLCFTPPDIDVAVTPRPPHRPLTFGSFNNHAKTSPATVALWARVLARVPDSRLLLKTKLLGREAVRRDLIALFAAHGIAEDRLILEGSAPRAELLAAYNRIDIALDPTPYGGGTTTAEAIWMGVPVVSLRGGTWVGRVSESILTTVGVGELVASDEDGYVDVAAYLADDAGLRTVLNAQLRQMLETSPLCNGAAFTRQLEAAYRGMWRTWCDGKETRS